MGKQIQIFTTDFSDIRQVKACCDRLNSNALEGFEYSIIKMPFRDNYSVVLRKHINRLYSNAEVVYPTPEGLTEHESLSRVSSLLRLGYGI